MYTKISQHSLTTSESQATATASMSSAATETQNERPKIRGRPSEKKHKNYCIETFI